jgi:hypothetical protein
MKRSHDQLKRDFDYLCEQLDVLIHLHEDSGPNAHVDGDVWRDEARRILDEVGHKLKWPLNG